MVTYILKEGVLNDDTLYLPDEGKVFKGGFVGFIAEYHFQNEWSDRREIKRFRKEEKMWKHINKNYPNFEL